MALERAKQIHTELIAHFGSHAGECSTYNNLFLTRLHQLGIPIQTFGMGNASYAKAMELESLTEDQQINSIYLLQVPVVYGGTYHFFVFVREGSDYHYFQKYGSEDPYITKNVSTHFNLYINAINAIKTFIEANPGIDLETLANRILESVALEKRNNIQLNIPENELKVVQDIANRMIDITLLEGILFGDKHRFQKEPILVPDTNTNTSDAIILHNADGNPLQPRVESIIQFFNRITNVQLQITTVPPLEGGYKKLTRRIRKTKTRKHGRKNR
jgi:hypothetical protein